MCYQTLENVENYLYRTFSNETNRTFNHPKVEVEVVVEAEAAVTEVAEVTVVEEEETDVTGDDIDPQL